MNVIQRFFDELKHPEKKCKRVGHNVKIRFRRGYVEPWKWTEITGEHLYRSVAMETIESQDFCSRCGAKLSEKRYSREGSLSGLGMNSYNMDILEKTGMYFSQEWEGKKIDS